MTRNDRPNTTPSLISGNSIVEWLDSATRDSKNILDADLFQITEQQITHLVNHSRATIEVPVARTTEFGDLIGRPSGVMSLNIRCAPETSERVRGPASYLLTFKIRRPSKDLDIIGRSSCVLHPYVYPLGFSIAASFAVYYFLSCFLART